MNRQTNAASATSLDTVLALATIRAMSVDGRARQIRERHKLSLTELAESIHVAPATLARWELGDRQPRGDSALRWLHVLRSLDELANAS